jgi:hypothetical protein
MKVYSAINAVQAELSKIGISKDRKNEQQNYKFRGIDDIYQAIAPLLAKNGLCILPRVLTREVVERVNARGTPLFYVTVAVEFDFVSAEDGSKHVVTTYGEAMDSADKATNKAMSAAYKYAALQAFAIPTEGDNDADATTHDVRPRDYRSEADALVAEIEAHDSPTSLAMWEKSNRPRVAELFKPAPAEFARVKAAKERLLTSFQTEQEAA